MWLVPCGVFGFRRDHGADDKILLKIGLAHGKMLDTGMQMFGDTWDVCELLGEELGEKRQILMDSDVYTVCMQKMCF